MKDIKKMSFTEIESKVLEIKNKLNKKEKRSKEDNLEAISIIESYKKIVLSIEKDIKKEIQQQEKKIKATNTLLRKQKKLLNSLHNQMQDVNIKKVLIETIEDMSKYKEIIESDFKSVDDELNNED
jgi:hypothetical protein